jgi:predicted Zn-dependent protease
MKGNKGKQFESMIGDLQTVLFDKGLDKNMEFEADSAAMETAYRSGYDPRGMITVLKKLKKLEASSVKKGSWFSTHPALDERIARLEAQLKNYPDAAALATVPDRFAKRVKLSGAKAAP